MGMCAGQVHETSKAIGDIDIEEGNLAPKLAK